MSEQDIATRSEQGRKTKLAISTLAQDPLEHRPVPELTFSPPREHDHGSFSDRMDDISIEHETRLQGIPPETLEHLPYRGPFSGTATSPVDRSSTLEDTEQNGGMGPEDQDLRQGLIFPEQINYVLQVRIDNLSVNPLRKTLSLNDLDGYGKIEQEGIELVNKSYQVPPKKDHLHFRGGYCIEKRNKELRPQYAIADRKQWQNMCRKLLKDFASGGITHCELLITREYSLLRLEATELNEASYPNEATDVIETTFTKNKARPLRLAHKLRLMLRENINGQKYLSRVDFDAVTSPQMIQAVINNSKDLADPNEKAELSKAIGEHGKRLFTMFVLEQTNMQCLKKLLDKGFHDNNLRKDKRQPFVCCDVHDDQLEPSSLAQRPIMLSVFDLIPLRHSKSNVTSKCVIPILPVAVDQNERSSDLSMTPSSAAADTRQDSPTAEEKRKDPAILGEGAHSQVFQVRIDPSHNGISENRDELFALKVITSTRHRPSAEESMLEAIASYKSPHLTKRLVSWTQGDKHCILFPLAECTLADYMKRHNFSNGEHNGEDSMVWLLEQLHGLADALVEIHTPKSDGEEQLSPMRHARSSSAEQQLSPLGGGQESNKLKSSYIGWHHDVKPQNILCFSNSDTKQKTFQLCDYGSSKINKYRSHSDPTATHRGTRTYEPPETALGSLSRPSDTWALGCVFLEIVTWAIEGYHGVESFREARMGERIRGISTEDDAFWEMLPDKSAKLREKVTKHLQSLKDTAQNKHHHLLLEVLNLIVLMLHVEKDLRVKMDNVRQQLLSIVALAKANL